MKNSPKPREIDWNQNIPALAGTQLSLPPDPSSPPPTPHKGRAAPGAKAGLFQPAGLSWATERRDIEKLLERSRHIEMRSIYYGSNACYLVVLEHPSQGRSLAVYKPARGEYPLWDFPQGMLYRREVATYRLSALLGWPIVPPTVVGSGRFGKGSVQLFIEEVDAGEVTAKDLRRVILLDWITNNADRKAEHVLVGAGQRLWAIDHGLTFHAQPKLRTVFWHFAGEPLDEPELADLARIENALEHGEADRITQLLDPLEAAALRRRVSALIRGSVFPDPQRKAVPYRW